SHIDNPWGAISDCYALNVDADTAWTCYYADFPIVRGQEGALTGWHGDGIAAKALITDGSRIALYGGYGADRNRLVTGELTDDRMQSTAQYRLVLPDGRDLPRGARVIGRGPNLHALTPTTCRPPHDVHGRERHRTISGQRHWPSPCAPVSLPATSRPTI